MINLNENKNYLKNYDNVSEDVKYDANSIIILKILASFFEADLNICQSSVVYRHSEKFQSPDLTTLQPRPRAYPRCGKRSARRRCLQAYQ